MRNYLRIYLRNYLRHLLIFGLLLPPVTLAASNDELLQIIKRLEDRIEQLESDDAVQSEPDGSILREVLEDKQQVIQASPPPQKPMALIPRSRPANPKLAQGTWKLYLNIEPENTNDAIQALLHKDVNQYFEIADAFGNERNLHVQMTLEGDGQRTKIGRSLLLRSRYEYDFDYTVQYKLFVDNELIQTSEQRLTSTMLQVDDYGRISQPILRSLRKPHKQQLKGLGIYAQFGCTPTNDYETNLDIDDTALLQVNHQACLQLTF